MRRSRGRCRDLFGDELGLVNLVSAFSPALLFVSNLILIPDSSKSLLLKFGLETVAAKLLLNGSLSYEPVTVE